MSKPVPLLPGQLRHECDPDSLGFRSTEEIDALGGPVSQARAVEALEFGISMRFRGYNVFALGPQGAGRHTLVRQHLEAGASAKPVPAAWCYVHNFALPYKPSCLSLPPGRGREFRADMERVIEELKVAIPAAFESDDHRSRRQALEDEFKERQENALNELQERAKGKDIALIRTPQGFALAPMERGRVVAPEVFREWPEEHQEKVRERIAELEGELQATMEEVPRWEREHWQRLRELNEEVTRHAIGHSMSELRERYEALPDVLEYLRAVERDLLENAEDFVAAREPDSPQAAMATALRRQISGPPSFRRYQVNLIADRSEMKGAPVVYQDLPHYANVFGRIEHLAQFGALSTDFTLIKPGALHEANGGYLILDARKVLTEPFVWEELKRALRSRELKLQGLHEAMGLPSTVSLDPEPIALDVKVVLVGEPRLYYLLSALDSEFHELFKVAAEFEHDADRNAENTALYARLLTTLTRQEGLRNLDAPAVARVIERASRICGDGEKLSLQVGRILDLLAESDHQAEVAGSELVSAQHVQQAIDASIRRANRLHERNLEHIHRGVVLIDTSGSAVGQVNALSVVVLHDHAFGRPSRVTARVRVGQGRLVDIEREVELGGPLHSKGVLILGGYLGERYARTFPLALSASLVFEQSYGEVDGDSASSAELYALLSALAGVPLQQSLAVTGSVNQHGRVQTIGGVNEKIEGFFDVCHDRGLTGDQGVLIPAANVRHLMLRADVVEAVERGEFSVYPIETIDEGIELLTGVTAGEADENGEFPEGTVNRLVRDQLEQFAAAAKASADTGEGENEGSKF